MSRACVRCDDLKARLEWLEGELGLREEADAVEAIRKALHVAPAVARFALVLYRARGKTVTEAQLADALPELDHAAERDDARLVLVYASRVRAAIGKGNVETVFGQGYRLTPAGLARLAAVLGEGVAI